MTLFIRRIVLGVLGIAAGLVAWPFSEVMLSAQSGFPSLLAFTIVSGFGIGALFGAVFGSASGIFLGRMRRAAVGAAWGLLIGGAGGVAGFLFGQGVLLLIGERFVAAASDVHTAVLPLSRALGWAVLGAFVGAADGIRARSGLRVRAGAAGGVLGGLAGGLAIEYGRVLLPLEPYARLAAFVFLGLTIALFFALVERRLSYGVLRLLAGPFKGTEYIMNQRRITVGSGDECDIVLSDYRGIAGRHLTVRERGGELFLLAHAPAVRLNDEEVRPVDSGTTGERARSDDETQKDDRRITGAGPLKYEDVIAIGSAKLLFMAE